MGSQESTSQKRKVEHRECQICQNLEGLLGTRSSNLRKGVSCVESASPEANVEELIDCNTEWWEVRKIRALFNPKIATEILKISEAQVMLNIIGFGTIKTMKNLVSKVPIDSLKLAKVRA